MWESDENLGGGRWILNLTKKYHDSSLETVWITLVS